MTPRFRHGWIAVLTLTALVNQFTVNVVRPVTTYKIDALGGDSTLVGIIAATYAVIPLISAMSLGRWVQRLSTLSGLMAAGLLVMAIGASAIAFSTVVWVMILGTGLLGLGQLTFTIGGQSAVSRASSDNIDSGFGWFTAGVSTGQMLGPITAGWIMSTYAASNEDPVAGIDAAIWFGAFVTVPAALLLLLVMVFRRRHKEPDEDLPPVEDEKVSTLKILRKPRMVSHIVASSGLLALTDILLAFFPLLGQSAGLSPTAVGGLLAVRGVASLSSRLLLGYLTTRIRRETLLVVSLFASAASFGALPFFAGSVWTAGLVMFVGGFFLGLGQPLTMSMVTLAVPTQWQPPALALRLVGNRLGQVVIPLVAGFLATPAGPGGAVWLGGTVILVSAAEQARHHPRFEDKSDE